MQILEQYLNIILLKLPRKVPKYYIFLLALWDVEE